MFKKIWTFIKSLVGVQDAPAVLQFYVWEDKALKAMTKVDLDLHAQDLGIELDRRQTKPNMLKEFKTKLTERGYEIQ